MLSATGRTTLPVWTFCPPSVCVSEEMAVKIPSLAYNDPLHHFLWKLCIGIWRYITVHDNEYIIYWQKSTQITGFRGQWSTFYSQVFLDFLDPWPLQTGSYGHVWVDHLALLHSAKKAVIWAWLLLLKKLQWDNALSILVFYLRMEPNLKDIDSWT